MTVSRVYSQTAGQIIEDALRDAKIIPAEQPVSDFDYQTGLNSLNKVSKRLQTKGLHQWLMERAVLPIIPGQQVYTLGPNGDPCGYASSFVSTYLTSPGVLGSEVLALASAFGIEGAPGLLESSPVVSTQDWEAINSAMLTINSGLRVANNGATQGGADYALTAEIGQKYRIRFSYVAGTSAGCIFSAMNANVVADTVTLTADGEGELEITASLTEITFRVQNTSSIAAQYSTVSSLQYVEDDGGSRIGVQLNDGAMQWAYVLDVDGNTVTINESLIGDAAVSSVVYSFVEQIDRPLQIFNSTYSSSYEINEIPVDRWSRQEYMQQPVKNATGTIVNVYYNPTLNDGKLYVWQTGQNTTNTLQFDVRKALAVYSEISDVLDFPNEYLMPLKWAIAADLAPSYGVPDNRLAVIEGKAAAYLEEAIDNDNELDSILVQPDYTR